jgi:aminoglycoside 3-N-acetyltransferase
MASPGISCPAKPGLVRALKQRLKSWLRWGRNGYIRAFLSFDNDALSALLGRLGLEAGDVVLAHVAFNQFFGFQGGPGDVIQVLQRALGPSGTLLMPTLPFRETAVEYAERQPLTDLVRTPSAMGFVTEIFRRLPGVIRSCHPTHSVAAWGVRAAELTGDHHLAETPCGKNSPFLRLLDVGGKILFLGADISNMTFYHGVEEILEPRLPVSPFTKTWYELRTRDGEGTVRTTRTRLFDPEVSRRRDMNLLLPELRRAGVWREGKAGGLHAWLVRASDALAACESMALQGRFVYRT